MYLLFPCSSCCSCKFCCCCSFCRWWCCCCCKLDSFLNTIAFAITADFSFCASYAPAELCCEDWLLDFFNKFYLLFIFIFNIFFSYVPFIYFLLYFFITACHSTLLQTTFTFSLSLSFTSPAFLKYARDSFI